VAPARASIRSPAERADSAGPAIVVILVDGQLRAAQAFEHQTDALRWADEQRVINAEAAR
jgi:hypothetical protein